MYMDYVERTLEYQIKRRYNDLFTLFDLCKQVVRSVMILH